MIEGQKRRHAEQPDQPIFDHYERRNGMISTIAAIATTRTFHD